MKEREIAFLFFSKGGVYCNIRGNGVLHDVHLYSTVSIVQYNVKGKTILREIKFRNLFNILEKNYNFNFAQNLKLDVFRGDHCLNQIKMFFGGNCGNGNYKSC